MARKLHRFENDFTDGFSYMYDKGIAHFDIKPQNILLGEDYRYKICDFGHSEKLESNETCENTKKCSNIIEFSRSVCVGLQCCCIRR